MEVLGINKYLALGTLIILPTIVALGAQNGTIITPIILIASVILFIILSVLKKVDSKYYPLYIFAFTLSLMWQTSMLGAHIVGSDMQGEFYSSNTVIQNGVWHPSMHYGTQSSTSIVVGWLAPSLSWLLHIDVIWVYKIILPILFSFTTVILYYAYRKQFGETKSMLACLFFMIVPISSLEVAQIGKMMVAEMFFSLFVLFLVIKLKWYWQLLCLVLSVLLGMFSHYTIGFALIAYIGGILIIRLLVLFFKNWSLFKTKIVSVIVLGALLVLSVLGCVIYYSIADQGVIMQVIKKVIPVYTIVVADTFGIDPNITVPQTQPTTNPQTNPTQTSTPTKTQEVVLSSDKIIKDAKIPDGYMDKLNDQELLIKTAIGFDFGNASPLGKIFRIIQYLTQLFIIIGGIYLVFNFKKYKVTAEFLIGIIASFILLAMCIFVPQFSMIINATRFYQISLFFLAPVFIIGFDIFGTKKWILPTIMIAYFIFTSGLVYEIIHSNTTDKLDVPYSAGLSAKRTGIYANFTQDDVNAVKWMIEQNDNRMIVSDYNGGLLVAAYVGLDRVREEGKWYNLTFDEVPNDSYVFLTTWNTENKLYLDSIKNVRGGAGLRVTKDLPELNYTEVYRSGNSIVLKNN